MTIRQMQYTSCEDGLEGIRGFQVSAMTPGTPRPQIDHAVRVSGYEPGPGLAAHLGDDDVSRFPVAFGYVPNGDTATLFRTRYAGTDFTGRPGNYFTHALLTDDPERDLAGMLPIELWGSPSWDDQRSPGPELPALAELRRGPVAGHVPFLAPPGRTVELRRLVGAVQPLLPPGRGRLVVIVDGDETAACWLGVLSRSLPRAHAARLSFVTYTSRPERQDVLISCTTPDVRVPQHGDLHVVDLTGAAPPGHVTRYAAVVAAAWEAGGVEQVLALAEEVTPPLAPAELDTFATAAELVLGSASADGGVTDAAVLDAVALVSDRLPRHLNASFWHAVADSVAGAGRPRDLQRWAAVLHDAQRTQPAPSALLTAYVEACLTAPATEAVPVWSPSLGPAELDDIAERVVLPALESPAAEPLIRRLADRPETRAAVERALERRLSGPREMERLVASLPPDVAHVLSARSGRVGLLLDLVRARHSGTGRAEALIRLIGHAGPGVGAFGELLWPTGLSVDDTAVLIGSLSVEALDGAGLADRIVDQMSRMAAAWPRDQRELRLAEDVLSTPLVDRLLLDDWRTLHAAVVIDCLRRAAPGPAVAEFATALDALPDVSRATADRLVEAIAAFVLRADDPGVHSALLDDASRAGGSRLVARYGDLARRELARAAPDRVATTIVAWHIVQDRRSKDSLLEKTLPAALSRRRAKYLDKVGTALVKATSGRSARAVRGKTDWVRWWATWRAKHEKRGLLTMLLGRSR